MTQKRYFITAIGTDSGKTVVSAIVSEALQADYWKPVQAGYPRDTETVKDLISNPKSIFHPETYLLNTPASPHASAKIDNLLIDKATFQVPTTENHLVIEGAGGALVPLNDHDVVIDLVSQFDSEIILVSNLYLGSINHTLLTVEALKQRQLPVKGIIFNGEENAESEDIILKKSGYQLLMNLRPQTELDRGTISKLAAQLKSHIE